MPSNAGGDFHTRFDAQIFRYALNDKAKIPRGGVAVALEHPMQGFLANAGLSRQFFETDFGIHEVAQYGKSNGGFTPQKAVNRFRIKQPREFGFTFYPRYDRFAVISCRNHVKFRFILSRFHRSTAAAISASCRRLLPPPSRMIIVRPSRP